MALLLTGIGVISGCAAVPHYPMANEPRKPTCQRIVTAEVVALEQVYYYNRFGSFNPAGLMYALRRDVVKNEEDGSVDAEMKVVNRIDSVEKQKETRIPAYSEGSQANDRRLAGNVKLRSDKRPRPLVLRANEGDCLEVTLTNLLSPGESERERRLGDPADTTLVGLESDEQATRHVGMHVNGLGLLDSIDSLGANVGRNGWHDGAHTKKLDGKCSSRVDDFGRDLCALAAPGETRTYRWYAKKEGTYFLYSMGAPAGGEGDGGQVGLGLFGAINVQPKGAKWYRSQVTKSDLASATREKTPYGQPVIDYEAVTENRKPFAGDPILNMAKVVRSARQAGKADRRSDQGWFGEKKEWKCKEGLLVDDGPHTDENPPNCHIPEKLEIVHSDLNAVIDIDHTEGCEHRGEGSACGKPYREFTVIFHDEATVVQAFHELEEEDSPLHSLRDNMAINYGSSGLGAMVVASRLKKVGPARDCVECKLEEFFLTSWVNGDPAMVVHHNGKTGKKEALYPDDPSNVHHSYLGDPIRFRNMHAGPKETHVFHLHAHQWVQDKHDPLSHYLDSQTISPGSTFSYEVHYGGSGNRNFGPGDSIFHCHLYPHFAQGMWELWRTHDVFEDGSKNRWLPDHEITDKTPTPAVVPLPRTPLPPMPDKSVFEGYPFYIAAQAGHRPPQPPLDLEPRAEGDHSIPTLRRHIIQSGTVKDGVTADEPKTIIKEADDGSLSGGSVPAEDLYKKGKHLSDTTARRVYRESQDPSHFVLARQLETIELVKDPFGENDSEVSLAEQRAMQFHAGVLKVGAHKPVFPKHGDARQADDANWGVTPYNWPAPGYPTCQLDRRDGRATADCDDQHKKRILFRVSGPGKKEKADPQGPPHDSPKKNDKAETSYGVPGAPFSNPCPKEYVDENGKVRPVQTREYRAVYLQMDMQVNKAGWHDPQARFPVLEDDVKETLDGTRRTEPLFFRANSGECIVFKATNLIPGNLNLDDFQVYSPTDTIGQHIHLVKFDVTSSDGSGNGWNYEDGTFAADEVRERIQAHNKAHPDRKLTPRTHRLFLKKGQLGAKEAGALSEDPRGWCSDVTGHEADDHDPINHPWCGAQTTIQRWWADPVLNGKPGEKKVEDRTMRTVFTHDHFGPSSHQHHGFYGALVVEPRNSKWFFLDGREMGGTDEKGTPMQMVKSRREGSEEGEKSEEGETRVRRDGGPTSYAANIVAREKGIACLNAETVECSHELDHRNSINRTATSREFNLAFADFAIVYTSENESEEALRLRPVNPPNHREGGLLNPVVPGMMPAPEGISTKDPGTQLINYRNEPIPLRIGERKSDPTPGELESNAWSCLSVSGNKPSCFVQKPGEAGEMAHVFSSKMHEYQGRQGEAIFTESLGEGRFPGDPATPLLQAYDGDRVQIRLIQGAQEEQHVFTMHGARWLSQPDSPNSGYVGAQHIGISEHFEMRDRVLGLSSIPMNVSGVAFRSLESNELCDAAGVTTGASPKSCTPFVDLFLASSAIDNLWDGQWGLLRMYPTNKPQRFLARLPGNGDTHPFASAFRNPDVDEWLDDEEADAEVMVTEETQLVTDPVKVFCQAPEREKPKTFIVEAWMAHDLLPGRKLSYNKSAGITDPDAILFVEQSRVEALKSGKDPEPLILRARAGECIEVTLINRLPMTMPDDPSNVEQWKKTWTWNMVPPIIEGFNLNQVRSSSRIGLHAALLDQNVMRSDGAHIGGNTDTTVPVVGVDGKPGEKTYLWYAGDLQAGKRKLRGRPIEFGVVPLTDHGDVIKHPTHGAIGALIIEPQCSEVEEDPGQQAAATVTWWEAEPILNKYGKPKRSLRCPEKPKEHQHSFREFVLLYQDALSLQQYGQPIPNLRNGDDAEDSGQKGFNYRTEPLWARLGASAADEPDIMNEKDWSNVLSSTVSNFHCRADREHRTFCDPATPIFTAKAGDRVRFRVVHPGGHPRQHSLEIFNHDWTLNPWQQHSTRLDWNQSSPTRFGSTNAIGPSRSVNILTTAGGDCKVPGDYLYRTQESFMFGGGLWGLLRVEPNEERKIGERPDACTIK